MHYCVYHMRVGGMQCVEICTLYAGGRDGVCRIVYAICECKGCSVKRCVYIRGIGGMQCVELRTLYAGARDAVCITVYITCGWEGCSV